MKLTSIMHRPDLDTLTAVIARSPIIVTGPALCLARLPAGFGEVDVAILRWIAAEGRRIGRGYIGV
jgi:hypothetical protein